MSISKIGSFVRKNPLIFNSFIYGSFYSGAEFLQQTYNIRNKTLEEKNMMNDNPPFTITIGTTWRKRENIFNESYSTSMLENYNWAVLQRYLIYGYFMAGPILHGWYLWLDKVYQGTAMKVVFKKLLCDQFILTPPLIVLFFTSMSWMEGRSNLIEECKAKFMKTFQTSCFYWIPMQLVNFLIISPPYRILFVSIASFCWINILCHLKRTPVPSTEIQK